MLALAAVGLPSEGLVVGIPGLVVGVVAQRVRVDLGHSGFLAVLLGQAAVDGVSSLFVQAHGVQRQAPLGGQLRQVSALGVEVVVDFVSCLDSEGEGTKKVSWTREKRYTGYSRSCTVTPVDHIQLQVHHEKSMPPPTPYFLSVVYF